MRQKQMTPAISAEEAIKDIRRATRRHWSAEDIIRIADHRVCDQRDQNDGQHVGVEQHQGAVAGRGCRCLIWPASVRIASASIGPPHMVRRSGITMRRSGGNRDWIAGCRRSALP
jgi:hypothetical protein